MRNNNRNRVPIWPGSIYRAISTKGESVKSFKESFIPTSNPFVKKYTEPDLFKIRTKYRQLCFMSRKSNLLKGT